VCFIHLPCFLTCVLFYFSFIWLHVYAFAMKSMVHCGSAFEPGASGLPYYCATPVCVPAVIGALAVRRQSTHTHTKVSAWSRDSFVTVHSGSALGPGASGLPYVWAQLVCVPAVIGGLVVWRHNKPKTCTWGLAVWKHNKRITIKNLQ